MRTESSSMKMQVKSKDELEFLGAASAGRPKKYGEVIDGVAALAEGECLVLEVPSDCREDPSRFKSRIYNAVTRDKGLGDIRLKFRLARDAGGETVLAVIRY